MKLLDRWVRFWRIIKLTYRQPDWVADAVFKIHEQNEMMEGLAEDRAAYIQFMRVHEQARMNAIRITSTAPLMWEEMIHKYQREKDDGQ